MIVMGATQPQELRVAREIVGEEMDFLIPGVGAQGGSVEAVMKLGTNKQGSGIIINSSRGVIFAADPASAAQELVTEIQSFGQES